MAQHDLDWFLQDENEPAYATLNQEQIDVLLKNGTVEYGDTEEAEKVLEDSDGSPAVAEQEPENPEVKVEEPVVQAKDGKNIIPFSELEDARAKAAQFEALAKDQATLIEDLKAAKVADKGTGDTVAQDEVLAKFKADFKENYEELDGKLMPLVEAMIAANGSKNEVAELKKEIAELKAAFTPLQKTAIDNSVEAHFAAIHSAVPDFDSLVESGAVSKWVETLPSYARTGANAVLKEGTATEIIELFKQYKETLGKPSEVTPPSKQEIKAAADKAIANAKQRTPTSLTDLPAGGTNLNEEMPTTVAGWNAYYSKMTPKQLKEALLS